MNQEKIFNWVMTTAVLLVLAIPVGIANIYLGYIVGESPCTLCWFQRIGMIVIGALGLCMLRYGPKIRYIATVFLFAAYGIFMGLRHVATHSSFDIGMGFGDKLFGAHTYTWSLFVYWFAVVFMGVMMFFLTKNSDLLKQLTNPTLVVKKLSTYSRVILYASIAVVASNCFQALVLNGVPPYTGKHAPDRITWKLNMLPQTWTTAVWGRVNNVNLLGKNFIENPFINGVIEPSEVDIKQGFKDGAVAEAPKLVVEKEVPIDVEAISSRTKYPIVSASYDPKNDEVALVTNELGAFYLDPDLKNVKEFAIFDKANGEDMRYIVGSAFAGDKLLISAYNKTITGVNKADKPLDPMKDWQTYRESSGNLNPVFGRNRPPLLSVRGKQQYINGMASDGRYLYTITLPNRWAQKLVLQKFDTKDFKLSAETDIEAAPDLKLKDGRNLNDYYVTGLTFHDGKIYAISPRYQSLLVINPNTAQVEKIYELEGLNSPRSPYFRNDTMYVLDNKEGRDYMAEVKVPDA